MKFATIFCRPKPMPTPAAPENTVSADRLMPTALKAIAIANTIRPIRITLPSSTCTDGVRSPERAIWLSAKLLATLDSHSATASITTSWITSSGVSRSPAKLIATESSADMAGSSCPMMLSAATSQAEIDTTRSTKGLRITEVNRRIASHASASLANTASR